MIDAEFKAKWLEALRSGRYTQSRSALHPDNGFCCLGVACDISGAGGWKDEDVYFIFDEFDEEGTQIESPDHIPTPLLRKINLLDLEQDELISLNDIKRKSFLQIADWIEANL